MKLRLDPNPNQRESVARCLLANPDDYGFGLGAIEDEFLASGLDQMLRGLNSHIPQVRAISRMLLDESEEDWRKWREGNRTEKG